MGEFLNEIKSRYTLAIRQEEVLTFCAPTGALVF